MSASMVVLRELSKTYRVPKREAGVWAAVRALARPTYTDVTAVDGISLELAAGERVGFLGPNGAGKTTTLKMLSGLLHPTGGSATVAGYRPQDRHAAFLKAITLVMGQKQQLLWDLPPADTFALNGAIYEVPPPQLRETLHELDALLELGELVKKPARTLSLGERMKCELAAALLHRPRVLFLDEPTIGLDVTMQVAVRDFVRRYNERFGATVILTSHDMDDVVALCPRIVVIDKGRLVFDGPVDKLVRSVRPQKRVVLKLSRPVEAADALAFGTVVAHEAASLTLEVGADVLPQVVAGALGRLPVVDLVVQDPPLEDVLRDLFQRSRETRETTS
jgi:ABC-2 type transport system ATP-binding protein